MPTTPAPPRRDFPAIRAALTIDPDALPAYANPAWPVHIVFLRTLTDEAMLTDPKFASPFR